MANDTQDEPSRNSIVGRSVTSPPPPYTSFDLKNDTLYHHHWQTVDDTVSKMQEVIENTYLMMQDLQNRLIRLECSNKLFTTSSATWIHDNSHIRDESHSADDYDCVDILDTMTQTVQQLLQEAQASLNRTITLPLTTNETMETTTSATFDQQSLYSASERKLDRTFELLMDQACSANFSNDGTSMVPAAYSDKKSKDLPLPVGQGTVLDYHYHHHHYHHYHHHHHHYHDDYSPPPTPLTRNGAAGSGLTTSAIPTDHSDYPPYSFSNSTNTMLSTATSKSVQLVQSWLSPLHRLTSLSPPSPSPPPPVNFDFDPPPSTPVLLPLSPSASATTTTISAPLSSAQGGKSHQQRYYYARLYRTIWILLITSRLLLDQHFRSPASFLHYNIHLLRPHQQQLWYKYKSSLLESSTSCPNRCRRMSRYIFITQFIYHIIFT